MSEKHGGPPKRTAPERSDSDGNDASWRADVGKVMGLGNDDMTLAFLATIRGPTSSASKSCWKRTALAKVGRMK
jgi:hypothetical protein